MPRRLRSLQTLPIQHHYRNNSIHQYFSPCLLKLAGFFIYLGSPIEKSMKAIHPEKPTRKFSIRRIFLMALILLLLAGGSLAWHLLGPATAFEGEKYTLYIRTGMSFEQLLELLRKDTVIRSPGAFDWLAGRMDYRENVKAGKYEIKEGSSLVSIIRMLHNGRQAPVHFVITKLRTRETLASW